MTLRCACGACHSLSQLAGARLGEALGGAGIGLRRANGGDEGAMLDVVNGGDGVVETEIAVGDGDIIHGLLGDSLDEAAEIIGKVADGSRDKGRGVGRPFDLDVRRQDKTLTFHFDRREV